MDRLPLKSIAAVAAALLAGVAASASAHAYEYTPYKGFNNTGQPTEPPPDSYTPTHQGGAVPGASYGTAAAGQASQGDARQGGGSDAYTGQRAAAAQGGYSSSEDVYSPPPRGAYSPSQDVYSPAHVGANTPPPGEGPSSDNGSRLPRIEVQAAAPDDGVPFSVRQDDARRAAIQGWSSKVADRYGPEFSQWRYAIGKNVDCHADRRNGAICSASAQPVRGAAPDNPWAAQDHRY